MKPLVVTAADVVLRAMVVGYAERILVAILGGADYVSLWLSCAPSPALQFR